MRAMIKHGLSEEEAEDRFWMLDRDGLITAARARDPRGGVSPQAARFARKRREGESTSGGGGGSDRDGESLLEVVRRVKPTVLIGLSGAGRIFSREVLAAAAAGVERPVVFAASNPTSRCECTSFEAAAATNGRAIYAVSFFILNFLDSRSTFGGKKDEEGIEEDKEKRSHTFFSFSLFLSSSFSLFLSSSFSLFLSLPLFLSFSLFLSLPLFLSFSLSLFLSFSFSFKSRAPLNQTSPSSTRSSRSCRSPRRRPTTSLSSPGLAWGLPSGRPVRSPTRC